MRLICFGLVALCFIAGCTQQEEAKSASALRPVVDGPDSTASVIADNRFIGSDKCIECHQDIGNAYKSSSMSRSVRLMHELSEDLKATLPVSIESPHGEYTVRWDDRE